MRLSSKRPPEVLSAIASRTANMILECAICAESGNTLVCEAGNPASTGTPHLARRNLIPEITGSQLHGGRAWWIYRPHRLGVQSGSTQAKSWRVPETRRINGLRCVGRGDRGGSEGARCDRSLHCMDALGWSNCRHAWLRPVASFSSACLRISRSRSRRIERSRLAMRGGGQRCWECIRCCVCQSEHRRRSPQWRTLPLP